MSDPLSSESTGELHLGPVSELLDISHTNNKTERKCTASNKLHTPFVCGGCICLPVILVKSDAKSMTRKRHSVCSQQLAKNTVWHCMRM